MTEPIDTGDEVAVGKRLTVAQRARKLQIEELQAILCTSGGSAFARRLLAECGVYRTSFAADPHVTAFNEGRRQMGLWLLAELAEAEPNVAWLITPQK
jgi:hypothetical protein